MDDDATLIADVEALQLYAAEAHLLTTDSPDDTDALRRNLQEPLAAALRDFRDADAETHAARRAMLLHYYSALNRLTGEVTGRSYRDSTSRKAKLTGLLTATIIIAALTILYETLGNLPGPWQQVLADRGGGYLRPMLWGALGSCIFLLKYLTDKISVFQFDRRQLSGIETRIALGATLGMVVVQLFSFDEGGKVDEAAAAFLAGLGVKAIYRALESAVEFLAEKLDFQSLKRDTGTKAATTPAVLPEVLPEALPTAPVPADVPAAAEPPAPEVSSRLSLVKIIQSRLAGLGFDPGPIDGVLGPRTVGTLLVCLKDATADEIKNRADLTGLAALLGQGMPSADWRRQIEALKDTPLKALAARGIPPEERKALEEALGLLRKKGTLEANGADTTAIGDADLRRIIGEGMEKLGRAEPAFATLGFSDALEKLRGRAAS